MKIDKKTKEMFENLAIANAELRVAKRESIGLFIIILVLFSLFVINTVNPGFKLNFKFNGIHNNQTQNIISSQTFQKTQTININVKNLSSNMSIASITVPAVDKQGDGVSTTIMVEAMPGIGRTLVDINNLLYWADTQNSIRTARQVAQDITGISTDNYDLIYHIYANASIVGGPSAGSAITIATIAVLTNKTLNKNVGITGTINHDGTIGPIGNILAKAKAAKQAGIITFLVPLTQGRDIIYENKKHCEKYGGSEFCTVEQIPKKINIGKEADINVVEVENIRQAMKYFF